MERSQRNKVSIFPPINHEDLPIPPHAPPPPPQPPHAPLTVNSDDHPSSSPPPPPKNNYSSNSNRNYSQFIKLFDFALHFWNSKLTSLLNCGVFSSFWNVAVTASFLGFVWYLFRWRCRKKCLSGGEEGVEHLKSLLKSKDEKILQLLEQIAHMNKVLLDRYKIPALKGS